MTAPNYGLFYFVPERHGVTVKLLELKEKNKFLPDANELEKLIIDTNEVLAKRFKGESYIPRVVAFLNINPHNPLGTVIGEKGISLLQKTAYATFAYKKLFNKKSAIALVFEEENANVLYDKMYELKKGVRAYIESNRTKYYFVDINNQWRAFEYYEGSGISRKYIESDFVKMAYLNGIHLEERALFDRDICYTFLEKEKIIMRKEKGKVDEGKDI